jgi:hypothetical protein
LFQAIRPNVNDRSLGLPNGYSSQRGGHMACASSEHGFSGGELWAQLTRNAALKAGLTSSVAVSGEGPGPDVMAAATLDGTKVTGSRTGQRPVKWWKVTSLPAERALKNIPGKPRQADS